MKKSTTPHDDIFHELMSEKVFAKAFIQQYCTLQELAWIDLDSMELWNAHLIDMGGQKYRSDIVYKVNTKKGLGYIVFLFEHQSTPEELMPFRILEYNVLLMGQHLQQGNNKLPIVIPIVFYHGEKTPYPYSTDIFDCFENPELAKQYLFQPFRLIDVTIIPDEELKRTIITAPMQIMMKHIRDKDLLPYFEDLALSKILERNAKVDGGKILMYVIEYIMNHGEISDKPAFIDLLSSHTGEARREVMTMAEWYRQREQEQFSVGMQQGVQQGMQQEKHVIAKNLLIKGIAAQIITETTGLSLKEINKIKLLLEQTTN